MPHAASRCLKSAGVTKRTVLRPLIGVLGLLAIAATLAACATTPAGSAAAARTELAPSGKLRAAINFGNPILAGKDAVTGEARGVSVDLARELGRRIGVPVELVPYTAAGKVVEGATGNEWDVAFVAIDPKRGADMAQTTPYVVIEGAYMVPQASPILANADVDRQGTRIVVGAGSAYDLYLSREIRNAQLVRAPTSPLVVDTMVKQGMEVAAGVRQQLEADAKRFPGLRILDGRFVVINQAMATPNGRPAGARYLGEFVEEMKASGFVAQALVRHRIEGAAVAPPGRAGGAL
jgi:polar amino acid transport system substrate-binding protein